MPTLKKLSPVLLVDAIEPVLPFWNRLGFAVTAEVPHGDRLGFVILTKDGLELMYQSRAGVRDDIPSLADEPSRAMFFLEVDDLDAVAALLGDAPVVVARRKTFYGMEEICVRDPVGNCFIFAQPTAS